MKTLRNSEKGQRGKGAEGKLTEDQTRLVAAILVNGDYKKILAVVRLNEGHLVFDYVVVEQLAAIIKVLGAALEKKMMK